jgi:NAD(P)-dependent dehydrogenase (short-subunit alcohol dehydrogenase family)
MHLVGAVGLVTGGGSGLGAATARRLVAAGARVVVVDRDGPAAEKVSTDLGAAAVAVEADVCDAEQMASAVAMATSLGDLRVAVSCAGIARVARAVDRSGAPHDLDLFGSVVSVNLIGTFNVCRLAAAAMAQSEPSASGERGLLIMTASVAAFDGQAGQTAYAASKAGVAGLTLPLARDLASSGVRVMSIAPGVFETPMLDGLSPAARQAIADSVPFPRRVGVPDDYADLVIHLAENSYLNGETIRLDGALRLAAK